jgi:RNA polymerase sigma factor (TIGR02999 family)
MPTADPTTLLIQWRSGDRAALDALFPVVYEDLRRRAHGILRHESPGHTLSTTALVHESYLKLIDGDRLPVQDRAHFLAVAARAMRQVLVSYARRHQAAKRGGGILPVELDEGALSRADAGADRMLELDRALEKLAGVDERLARTVEMRFFGGMTVEEIAQAQDRASSTVKLDWQKAKGWLAGELE